MVKHRSKLPWWERYEVQPSGCWNWTHSCYRNGYAKMAIKAKAYLAHRKFYEHYVGPIPDGLQIDHLCRNRKCVNPKHLEPVTQQENINRGVAVPVINRAKTHCFRGHPFTSENTYHYTSPHGPARQCLQCNHDRRDIKAPNHQRRGPCRFCAQPSQ